MASKALERARRQQTSRKIQLNLKRHEDAYVRELRGLLARFHTGVVKAVLPLVEELGTREDATPKGVLRNIENHGIATLRIYSRRLATGQVKRLQPAARANALLLGLDPRPGIGKVLVSEFVERNVDLITEAGRAYVDQVRDIFKDDATFGKRVETIKAEILARGNVSESRAELIARDQTLKLNGEINREQQERAGVDQYVWSTSLDERVRDTHQALEGRTFAWSDPPEIGHPGEDFQCRCAAIPVISFEE